MMESPTADPRNPSDGDIAPGTLRWLKRSLREDWRANTSEWSSPGFRAVAVHRFGVWAAEQKRPLRLLLGVLYRTLYRFVRNFYGIELPRAAQIGRRLSVPHQGGIVIGPEARIGDDCVIRQNVTIGRFNRGRRRDPPYTPRLGNRVEVGPGAVLVGGIEIGDDVRIGPNAVVVNDVPPRASVFAQPAQIMAGIGRARDESDSGPASGNS